MTRNAITLLMLDVFDIFAQVSESCAHGYDLQDLQAVSPFILPGRQNQCGIFRCSRIYHPA